MIVTTGNDVTGHSISTYVGIVRGIVVRSPNIAQGLLGGRHRHEVRRDGVRAGRDRSPGLRHRRQAGEKLL